MEGAETEGGFGWLSCDGVELIEWGSEKGVKELIVLLTSVLHVAFAFCIGGGVGGGSGTEESKATWLNSLSVCLRE